MHISKTLPLNILKYILHNVPLIEKMPTDKIKGYRSSQFTTHQSLPEQSTLFLTAHPAVLYGAIPDPSLTV